MTLRVADTASGGRGPAPPLTQGQVQHRPEGLSGGTREATRRLHRYSWGHHHASACLLPPLLLRLSRGPSGRAPDPLSPTTATLRSHVCELAPLVTVPVPRNPPNSAARQHVCWARERPPAGWGPRTGHTHLRGRLLMAPSQGLERAPLSWPRAHHSSNKPSSGQLPSIISAHPQHPCKVGRARAPCSPPF